MNELYILTGPSGSGVTSSKFVFEELGFYVVENAPSGVTDKILDVFYDNQYSQRGLCLLSNIFNAKIVYDIAKSDNRFHVTFILLDCKKEEIIKRYALSRHDHPRAILHKMPLEEAIDLDIKEAEYLSSFADLYVDTTNLSTKELRHYLYNKIENKGHITTKFTFMSFGFKNGTPAVLDMVIDVRILPNPYWVNELAPLNGTDKPVIDYINSFPITHEFLKKVTDYLSFIFQEIQKSERPSYTVGIACSGGQHRSTFVAEYLKKYFQDQYSVSVIHRDSPYLMN